MQVWALVMMVTAKWVLKIWHSCAGYQALPFFTPVMKSKPSRWFVLQQSMLAMHSAMSSVHSTGNDDEDFVGLMLPHHQAALDMARVELTHGRDPQMRRLAQEIIADQESEIGLMQLWLRQNHAGKPLPSSSAAKDQ